MHKQVNILSLLILATGILSCNNGKEIKSTVKHKGALMNMMSGNLEATVSLDSLQTLPHLYALGAIENLKGEIQILDGISYISKTDENQNVRIESTFDHKAALLVYAQVPEWTAPITLDGFSQHAALETQIKTAAIKNGMDIEQPIPFLLKGTVSRLQWHVINWPAGDSVHTHKKHQESGAHGVLEKENVTILGFYSEKHKAVFTHHTTFLHMHFKTESDNSIAGHIDEIQGEDLKLYLPIIQ